MEHTRVDESSFDHLARLAATGTARRTLLRAGVAAVVAGLGAAVGFASGPGRRRAWQGPRPRRPRGEEEGLRLYQ